MKIIIDGDGCPVVGLTIEIAKKFNTPVTVICDTAHIMQDDYAECVIVDKGSDSADFVIVNRACAEDIVITQDYGLGAMCLGKGATALNQNGMLYTTYNIDRLLMQRHINKKIRQGGGRTAHAKKRTAEQNTAFELALTKLLEDRYGKG